MSMATQEVFNEISDLVESFKNEHEKNADVNKAAGLRARKAATQLKKLLTDYRKESIEGTKD